MYKNYIKRILDIFLSLIVLIIVLPLCIIVGILIKLDSEGPILFKQERIGKNGKRFWILKFRSMVVGAERKGTGVYSLKNDLRVTKIGKFIRATSIDELPQLINILKGEMSIIGPRPVLVYHPWPYEEYTEEQLQRFNLKPGVTGWAQVNGRKDVEWNKRIELDRWYVNNISFILDLKILFKTIFKVLKMEDNFNMDETSKSKLKKLNLMYITNNPEVAIIAQESGVDRIFIDLEILGKEERQGHLDTVISKHNIEDVSKIRKVLNKSDLLVRVNPINENSQSEIDYVIEQGADIVMLPFFKTLKEVELFIDFVNVRAKVCLLLETPEAVENIDEILNLNGIDEIHIGLNDLHLGYKKKFMFELLADGTVENLCNKFKEKNVKYGFGGIAKIGEGSLPAEHIIIEHYRLGSTMVILSRSFCDAKKITDTNKIEEMFKIEVEKIRNFEKELKSYNENKFNENKKQVSMEVENIVEKIKV